MPPRIKKTFALSSTIRRFSTVTKLAKMKKPKKINIKLRDHIFAARGLHQGMEEALEATKQALWDGEYQEIHARMEEI